MVKVYTKTGDGGYTTLFNGESIQKNASIMNALGDIDELNVSIGLFSCSHSCRPYNSKLLSIQSTLMDICTCIATPLTRSSDAKRIKTVFQPSKTVELEDWIDEMSLQLPELTTFVLPAGETVFVHIHTARVICRRAERSILEVKSDVDPSVIVYMNRLSDAFFVLACFVRYERSFTMEYIYPLDGEKLQKEKLQKEKLQKSNFGIYCVGVAAAIVMTGVLYAV